MSYYQFIVNFIGRSFVFPQRKFCFRVYRCPFLLVLQLVFLMGLFERIVSIVIIIPTITRKNNNNKTATVLCMFLRGNFYVFIMDQQNPSSSYNDVHAVLSYFSSINDSIHSEQLVVALFKTFFSHISLSLFQCCYFCRCYYCHHYHSYWWWAVQTSTLFSSSIW